MSDQWRGAHGTRDRSAVTTRRASGRLPAGLPSPLPELGGPFDRAGGGTPVVPPGLFQRHVRLGGRAVAANPSVRQRAGLDTGPAIFTVSTTSGRSNALRAFERDACSLG